VEEGERWHSYACAQKHHGDTHIAWMQVSGAWVLVGHHAVPACREGEQTSEAADGGGGGSLECRDQGQGEGLWSSMEHFRLPFLCSLSPPTPHEPAWNPMEMC